MTTVMRTATGMAAAGRPSPQATTSRASRWFVALIPIIVGLAILGFVTAMAAVMLVFLGQDWDDALFWIFAAVMIGSALLVVTMRDIIRCGLAMMVCFGALAGIYVSSARRCRPPPRSSCTSARSAS